MRSASEIAARLPAGFQIGVGTSAWQVEGASGSRGRTIWDDFADIPGAIVDGARADPACEQVTRVDSDVQLLGWLGVDAYRFSISWARVRPGGRGDFSAEGIAYYDRLCDLLLEKGVTPNVTLYHWDLPSELFAQSGWLNAGTAELFAEYAEEMARRLGDRVGAWATLNEPWCAAFLGHAAGIHAPGRREAAEALEVAYRLLVGHAHGLAGLRAGGARNAGIVLNMMPTFPDEAYRDNLTLQRAAKHIDGLQNFLWLDALAGRGINPEVVASTSSLTDWAFVEDDCLSAVAAPIDWLGVNYYTVQRLAPAGDRSELTVGQDVSAHPGCPDVEFDPRPPLTTMGWEINPQGLTTTLTKTAQRLPGVPLWVAENGLASADEVVSGKVDDQLRVDYLARHLDAALDASELGVDLRGYFAWSLLDNIEWAQGWRQRFGIVHVDQQSQVRTPKASAHWLRQLQASRQR